MEFHFWLATLAVLFYTIPLYISGWMAGLMWKQFTPEGLLQYPNFLEIALKIVPLHAMRAVGGAMYLTGALIMIANLAATMIKGKFVTS